MIYRQDQRVMTPYGQAKVLAFERFDRASGRSIEPSISDYPGSDSRVIVRLDTPTNWPCHQYGDPYLYRKDLSPLED